MGKELKNFYAWLILGLIAIALTVYFIASLVQSKQDDLIFGEQTHPEDNTVIEESSGFGSEVTQKPDEPSYEEIRDSYEGRRIQLDNCVLQPNRVTYKNGTKIMLDNRSVEPTEIRIDGKIFRLWGYEYKIVTLSSKNLPHTLDFDCEYLAQPQYNVAQVLLQP